MLKIINILIVILLFLSLIFCSIQETKKGILWRKKISWMFSFFIIIFFGLRDFGLDLLPYKNIYNELDSSVVMAQMPLSLFTPTLEPVYTFFIAVSKKFGLSYGSFLLFSALITFTIVSWVSSKDSEQPILMLLMFCLLYLFKVADAVRHGTASAIYLIGIYFISNRHRFKGIVLVFFSIFFHYSNILLLMMIPALNIRWNIKSYIFFMIFIASISIPFGLYVKEIAGSSDLYLLWKLHYYLDQQEIVEYQNDLHLAMLTFFTGFTFASIFFINIYLLINKKLVTSDFHVVLLNSQILGSLISIIFIALGATTLATRILLPAAFGQFMLFQYFLKLENKNLLNFNKFIILTLILLIYNFIIVLYNAGIHDYMSPFYIL